MAVQLHQVARGLEFALAPRLVKQRAVHVLNGRGVEREQGFRGLHGLGHGGEEQQAHAPLLGQGNNLEFGFENGRQRAFAAGQEGKQVGWRLRRAGQRIPRPAF